MAMLRFTARSIAAAAAAGRASRSARAFARLVDVARVRARDGIAVERHDRVGEVIALVRLDPGLDAAAADESRHQGSQADMPNLQRAHRITPGAERGLESGTRSRSPACNRDG